MDTNTNPDAARMPTEQERMRISKNLIYSTAINLVRVQVREAGSNVYYVDVQRNGIAAATFDIDGQTNALAAADILRDIYHNCLDFELLAH